MSVLVAGLVLAGVLAVAAAAGPQARAAAVQSGATPAELALAERYAPIVRLKERPDSCGIGEPYRPTDVAVILDNREVALRGPWDTDSVVDIAPSAGDLARGLFGYHLDFPGDALDPGCTYEEWERSLAARARPMTYARAATEPGVPGRLALQYWFFYTFNDWNNTHEGDWEMIQLNFDVGSPEEALRRTPVEVGFSQHKSGERADWGDEKLELVDGTHPVVYPAEGSQANFFGSELHLMSSSAEGLGCDDTVGPSREIRPDVAVIPANRAAALAAFPWLGFEGRWGEQQAAFFNAPAGPNRSDRWARPLTFADANWREQTFTVPSSSGPIGTRATDIFCGAVERGSTALRQIKLNPGRAALILGGLVLLLLWPLARTRWEPATPRPIAGRRSWGQLVTSATRMFGAHPRVFLGIGLLFIPLGVLITLLQWLLFRVTTLAPLVDEAGTRHVAVDMLAFGLGLVLTLLALGVVQAATARAMVEIDAGRRVTALDAYRWVLRRARRLAVPLGIAVAIQIVLDLTLALIPVAIFLLVRWTLLGVVVGVEGEPQPDALRRSSTLTRGNWWRTASVGIGVTGLALLIGPVLGVIGLLFTGATFDLINMISALVYVVAVPFGAIVLVYHYFDLRAREDEAPATAPVPGDAPVVA